MNKIFGLGFFCVLSVVVAGTALIEIAVGKYVQSSVINWVFSAMDRLAWYFLTR